MVHKYIRYYFRKTTKSLINETPRLTHVRIAMKGDVRKRLEGETRAATNRLAILLEKLHIETVFTILSARGSPRGMRKRTHTRQKDKEPRWKLHCTNMEKGVERRTG